MTAMTAMTTWQTAQRACGSVGSQRYPPSAAVDDERLAAALSDWARDHGEGLAERVVRVEVEGPFDPMGISPVYLLRLRSSGNEAEASLFRDGTLLLATYDGGATDVRQSHVDAVLPSDVTAALTALAEGV